MLLMPMNSLIPKVRGNDNLFLWHSDRRVTNASLQRCFVDTGIRLCRGGAR